VPTEAQLQHLYQQLTGALDVEGANTLMDIVSPMARNELATRSDLVELRSDFVELRGDLRAEMAELRTEMSDLGGTLRAEMSDLRGELRAEMGNLKGELFRMMLATQGATIAVLGLLITYR